MKHHEFSPSKLEQYRICPASYYMQKGLPDTTSAAAEEGTLLHAALAKFSADGLNSEQTEVFESCVNYLDSLTTGTGNDEIITELPLTIKDGSEVLTTGTADVVIYNSDMHEVSIIDWKFGYTPVMNVMNNIQLATYAVGAMQKYGVSTCKAHVFQPRIRIVSGYTFTDQKAIIANINNIINKAQSEKLVFNATDESCRYCKARLNCPAFRMKYQKLAASSATYDLTNINTLVELYEASRSIKTFVSDIENRVKQVIEEQGECGKYVFDIKEGNREIKDLNTLYSVVKDYLTPQEFNNACKVSIGKLEKLLAEKFIAAEAITGVKLTMTEAKKRCYDMLSTLVTRGNPTKTITVKG